MQGVWAIRPPLQIHAEHYQWYSATMRRLLGGERMISKGKKHVLRAMREVLAKESGLTANLIQLRMANISYLRPHGPPHVQVIAQLLRSNEFVVVGKLPNRIKTYALRGE